MAGVGIFAAAIISDLRHALYCVRRGECGPSAAEVVRMVGLLFGAAGQVGSQAADYPGLKKLQTDGYVFSSDNAQFVADRAADVGGFAFRWATVTVEEDKNVTLPTGGTAGIFGLFRVRVCVSCGSLNVRRNGGCIAGLTTIKAI